MFKKRLPQDENIVGKFKLTSGSKPINFSKLKKKSAGKIKKRSLNSIINTDSNRIEKSNTIESNKKSIPLPDSDISLDKHTESDMSSQSTNELNGSDMSLQTVIEQGTPQKAHRSRRSPAIAKNNIYPSELPKFGCNECPIGFRCPNYKAGHECAYESQQIAVPDLSTPEGIEKEQENILITEILMIRRQLFFINMESGIPTPEVMNALDLCFHKLSRLYEQKKSFHKQGNAGTALIMQIFGGLTPENTPQVQPKTFELEKSDYKALPHTDKLV